MGILNNPKAGHILMSMLKARFKRYAQVMDAAVSQALHFWGTQ
jgi:hypothetical protein